MHLPCRKELTSGSSSQLTVGNPLYLGATPSAPPGLKPSPSSWLSGDGDTLPHPPAKTHLPHGFHQLISQDPSPKDLPQDERHCRLQGSLGTVARVPLPSA